MDRNALSTFAATNRGELATVTYTDGSELTVVINGNVNTKGLVVRHHADEPVFYIAPTKIVALELVTADDEVADEVDADEEAFMDEAYGENDAEDVDTELEDIVNEISDGATTAEIAAHLTDYLKREITPKELRVHLRALGLGVGKGRKYALSSGEFRAVVNVINAPA